MAQRPPPTNDGFLTPGQAGRPGPTRAGASEPSAERISLEEVLAIFRPDNPPMAAVKLVWDNPDGLDLPAMRLRLRTIAKDLKAKPLSDAIDAMMLAVDDALLQLETDPAGLTLPQAKALRNAAVQLRQILAGTRSRT